MQKWEFRGELAHSSLQVVGGGVRGQRLTKLWAGTSKLS